MNILKTASEVSTQVETWKREDKTMAFVPTMGGLHAGHLALVEEANRCCDVTVVSIFVNPTQFGINEDYSTYPRTFDEDIDKLGACSVDAVFAPEVREIYPHGEQATTSVYVRGLSDVLEGECRPGFFTGVATIVCKLFNIVQPDVAIFGEKDYQQYLVVSKMVADLNIPVNIRPVATVREADGLAMSSRNAYLDETQRKNAPELFHCLQSVKQSMQDGMDVSYAVVHACQALETTGFDVDYVVVRRRQDLAVPTASDKQLIALAAARLGSTRLIDNLVFDLIDSS